MLGGGIESCSITEVFGEFRRSGPRNSVVVLGLESSGGVDMRSHVQPLDLHINAHIDFLEQSQCQKHAEFP